MATWSYLTGRRLKAGEYDAWRRAWEPDEWPQGVTAYIMRRVGDPDDVIAFGLFEGTQEEFQGLRPDPSVEEARAARMEPHIASVFADGAYEVVEVVRN